MQYFLRFIVVSYMALALSSCAAYSRETRLVAPQSDFEQMWVSKHIELNKLPRITLSSSCVDEQGLFIGPFIAIPLPVIPNVFWPFGYASYKKREAWFHLEIKAPPKMLDWDSVVVEISINGLTMTQGRLQENSNEWHQDRTYSFKAGTTCGEIEEREITVNITGLPDPMKSTIMLRHRWRLKSED